MTLKFLMNRRRKQWQATKKEASVAFVKDAVIAQLQTMWGAEIKDIDIDDGKTIDDLIITIYTDKKGAQSKTKKD